MEDELLTLAETARMLGLRPVTLRKWDREGKLKALRIGSRGDRRYQKSDILQVLESAKVFRYDIQELDGSLLSFFDYIEEFINGTKKIFGQSITKHITISNNGHVKIAYSYQELLDTGKLIVEKLRSNPEIADKIIEEFNLGHQKISALITKFENIVPQNEIEMILSQVESIYRKVFARTMIIEPLDAYLLRKIKEKIKVEPKQFTEIFGILTTPPDESFLLKEKKEILEIAKNLKKDKIFLTQPKEKQKDYIEKNHPEIFKKIKEHTRKYIWLKTDYVKSVPLKFEDILGLINEQLPESIDIERELNKLKDYLPDLKKRKAEIIKQINSDEELRHLIWIIDKIGPLHDWRKEWFLKTIFLFEKILEAISKKHRLPIDALRSCSPKELFEIIKTGHLDLQLMDERRKYCVILSDKTGHKIYYGEEAHEIEKRELGSGRNEILNLIKGTAVSAGKAVGIAKVAYSAEEAKAKIQKGDILITSMTRPDFVPVMKLASGIVTNEGGLTCHAAIVSREMGLPCVVGTKHATETIRDGDIIEVNGNHGIVYIIKRKSEQSPNQKLERTG